MHTTVWRVGEGGRRAGGDGFAAWLRGRSDAELAALFIHRPDLLTPAPVGIRALAARATARLSLQRALDDLDEFALHVVAALVTLPAPVSGKRLRKALAAPREPLRRCLAGLCARALAWQAADGLRAAPGLSAALDGTALPGGPCGFPAQPPPLDGILNGSAVVDQAAAGAALRAIQTTEGMLSRWGATPPRLLKSGGLGIRELRNAAASAGVEVRAAALYTEVARAAGLLAASGWAGGEWLPSRAFDDWRDGAPAARWAALVSAWLSTTRVAALVGTRDEHGRQGSALGAGLDRMDAPRIRSWVLAQLADLAPGESASVAAMLRRLAWRWPRAHLQTAAMLAEAAMAEAELLGLTGHGALSAHGRAMVRAGPAEAASALAGILPAPVGYVLLQSDLTAVAPGPLTAELRRELAVAADVESTGGATVYRFSADSLRRALDAGRDGDGLLKFFAENSRTPVPQPLRYLVEDVARRHGRVRAGPASSYVRCDDEALLAEILADRRCARLRLRPLAPTVLVSAAGRDDVLRLLRQLGFAPAAESADGAAEIVTASRRAEDRAGRHPGAVRPGAGPARPPWTAQRRAVAAVRVLRASND